MGREALAEVELSALIRVLVLGPRDAVRSGDASRLLRYGTVVAVTAVVLDDPVDLSLTRPRWSDRLAASVARHDELFHALFD